VRLGAHAGRGTVRCSVETDSDDAAADCVFADVRLTARWFPTPLNCSRRCPLRHCQTDRRPRCSWSQHDANVVMTLLSYPTADAVVTDFGLFAAQYLVCRLSFCPAKKSSTTKLYFVAHITSRNRLLQYRSRLSRKFFFSTECGLFMLNSP